MTPDEMYERASTAYSSDDLDERERLLNIAMAADDSPEGMALFYAFNRAQEEHITETFPRLRAAIGTAYAAGHEKSALLLERIFFDSPDLD